ncbi:MAG: Tim44/TimA family putative adaptor protein [Kiloniellaceae bacterium]
MSNGFPLDIILFVAIAAFFVLRLRGVLGKRTGQDKPPPYDPFGKRAKEEPEEDKVIHLPDHAKPEEIGEAGEEAVGAEAAEGEPAATPFAAALAQIKLADPGFDEGRFLTGARGAFETIISSFAGGSAKTLRPLLSNDVYNDFAGAIEARRKARHTLDTTLVDIADSEIVDAELQGRTAFVTVKFVSEQVNVTRDTEGEVVEGDPDHVAKITDIWTFARNTRSRDPNWTLVATRSPN